MKMTDYQTLFNFVTGLLGVVGGWWLNAMWASLKELQSADAKLAEKVSAIEVLVAGQYVTRDELTSTINAIFAKLDKIQDTLTHKVDRRGSEN